ncbi:MAG: hypothetical protein HQL29_05130 [Candidatus Omnitrophica bacterium]|nr:hypothetical protein [Candidatus Omnitrophota bacterium]
MEKIFYNIDHEDFIVHIEQDEYYGFRIKGEVYPIQKYKTVGESAEKWGYIKLQDGDIHEEHEPDITCRKLFDFSFCWKGVWEGRIYFKDDEYWSDEIKIMSELWEQISATLKEKIKSNDPSHNYDD